MKKFIIAFLFIFSFFKMSAIADVAEYDKLSREILSCQKEMDILCQNGGDADQIQALEGKLQELNLQIQQIEDLLKKQRAVRSDDSSLNEFDIKNKNKVEIVIKYKVLVNDVLFKKFEEDKKFKPYVDEYQQVIESYLIQSKCDVDFLYQLYSIIFNLKRFKLDLDKKQKELNLLINDMLKILDKIAEFLGYPQFKSDQNLFNLDLILQEMVKKLFDESDGIITAEIIEKLFANDNVQQALAGAVENMDPSLSRKIFGGVFKSMWRNVLAIFGMGK